MDCFCHILVFLCFTSFLFLKGLVSGRRLPVNLYSAEENSLLRSSRAKRSLNTERFCTEDGCCDSRNDNCSFYYIGKNATCYCDRFCDQKPLGHVDCCPDFWLVCSAQNLQQTTTRIAASTVLSDSSHKQGCFKDGSYYEDKATWKNNCNYCYCRENQWICSDYVCLIQPTLIDYINTGGFSWKANNYSQFWGMTLKEGFEFRLGTIPPSLSLLNMNEMAGRVSLDEEFPLFFISSYKWPQYIHRPLDQNNCAASWAFSTASVAADRIAIHSEGRYTSNLSPQNLISCSVHNQYGCRGGHLDGAWWFLRKRGLVSHECYPYVMDDNNNINANICNISSITDKHGKSHATKPCPNSIEDSNYLYQCSPPYRIPSNEKEIMKEIMDNGPVQAVMTVYEDFFLYKTGIYRHTSVATNEFDDRNDISDTHSVKIIGLSIVTTIGKSFIDLHISIRQVPFVKCILQNWWGSLGSPKKEKFWIAANSWGNTWGENGYFRIVRGENECGIENFIIAAWCHGVMT